MVHLFYLKIAPKNLKKGEKPYKCDQCSYVCVQNSNLTKHKQTHTGSFFRCMSQSILNRFFAIEVAWFRIQHFGINFLKENLSL